MKINLVVSKNPWVSSSASSNRLLSLLEGIIKYDVLVNIFITDGYSTKLESLEWQHCGSFKKINFEYVNTSLIEGYWEIRFYTYISKYFSHLKVIEKITKKIKSSKGLVWTEVSTLGFELVINIKKESPHIKVFSEFSEFLDIHLYNKGNFLQNWQGDVKQRLFEKKAFFAYDGMALMTKTLLKHYQSFPQPQPKLFHLPMTVDLDRFKTHKEPLEEFMTPYIAFVGVMNDAKDGVSILIKAFNSIKEKFPNHKVYLVGAWNYDTPIHLQLIKEYELESRVFWMKEFPRDQIPNIICNADLLVLPRPDSKQAQGGFPTKLGEYLATGKPVCATTVGEIPDYLVDNESVFFAEPGSVESFGQAMDRALSDPENGKRVGLNGRLVAEREFNKDVQAKKLYEFLKELEAQEPSRGKQKEKDKR